MKIISTRQKKRQKKKMSDVSVNATMKSMTKDVRSVKKLGGRKILKNFYKTGEA